MDAQSLNVDRRRPSLTESLINLTRRGPVHAVLLIIGIIWLVPSVGLAVTSFRTRGDISASGWWTIASGNRTITDKLLELNVSAEGDSSENAIVAGSSLTGESLDDAVPGVPAATVRLVRVQRIRGTFPVEAIDQPIPLDGVGTLTVHEDGTYDFLAEENFVDAFVADVNTDETPFAVNYELSGFESIQGDLEIAAIGEDVRVPRAGKITVNADGSYKFEPRSSFAGAFLASINPDDIDNPPFTIQYSMERAGGPLLETDPGTLIELPLAGAFQASQDGLFEFHSAADFTGTVDIELGIQNALLTLDNYSEIFNRPQLAEPGFINFFKNSFIITIPSTIIPIAIASLAAYAFTWLDLPYRNVFYLARLLRCLIVPLQITWIPVLRMLNTAGLIGTWPGIWIAHIPPTARLSPSSCSTIFSATSPANSSKPRASTALPNSACSSALSVPLSLPALASLAIFQFVWVWNDLMNALIFLVDQQKFPLTVGIRQLVGQYANEWDILASGAFITMIVPLTRFLQPAALLRSRRHRRRGKRIRSNMAHWKKIPQSASAGPESPYHVSGCWQSLPC